MCIFFASGEERQSGDGGGISYMLSRKFSIIYCQFTLFHTILISIIYFREEQEKLNVWVAYMNLENMYGTADTLKVVFDRAVQHNEPMKVYNQLVKIYEKSEKEEVSQKAEPFLLIPFIRVHMGTIPSSYIIFCLVLILLCKLAHRVSALELDKILVTRYVLNRCWYILHDVPSVFRRLNYCTTR